MANINFRTPTSGVAAAAIKRVYFDDFAVYLYYPPWIPGAVVTSELGNVSCTADEAYAMFAALAADDNATIHDIAKGALARRV